MFILKFLTQKKGGQIMYLNVPYELQLDKINRRV